MMVRRTFIFSTFAVLLFVWIRFSNGTKSQNSTKGRSPNCKDVRAPGWSIEKLRNVPYDSWPASSCILRHSNYSLMGELISEYSSDLYHAASKGFLGFVQYYVAADGVEALCERSRSDDDGLNRTPIQIAIANQRLNILQYVAKQTHTLNLIKCMLDEENFSNTTEEDFKQAVFRTAAKSGDVRVLRNLVETKKTFRLDLNRDEDAIALFKLAGLTNTVDYYRQEAITLGVNPTKLIRSRLLNHAVMGGNVEAVRFLIEILKFDVNLKDEYGWSATHCAAFWGSFAMLQYLVEVEGADLNLTTDMGNTVLHSAASAHGSVLLVKYLALDKRLNVNQRNELDQTPLYFAVWNGHFGIVAFLTAGTRKADLYVRDSPNGRNLLHRAALSGHLHVLKYLMDDLNMASHVNETERYGYTAAMNAARCVNRRNALPILRYLVDERQATTDGVNLMGLDILMIAAQEKHLSVVRYLVEEKGFDLHNKYVGGLHGYVMKSAYDMLLGHSCAGSDCEWLKEQCTTRTKTS